MTTLRVCKRNEWDDSVDRRLEGEVSVEERIDQRVEKEIDG